MKAKLKLYRNKGACRVSRSKDRGRELQGVFDDDDALFSFMHESPGGEVNEGEIKLCAGWNMAQARRIREGKRTDSNERRERSVVKRITPRSDADE